MAGTFHRCKSIYSKACNSFLFPCEETNMIKIFTLLTALLFGNIAMAEDTPVKTTPPQEALAIMAGGCFWCLEPPFDNQTGVNETISGYIGGHVPNPTYEDIGTGQSGHREAIAIHYDPTKVDYTTLINIFFETIDPFDATGQFVDKGHQYTTAIYVASPQEETIAKAAIAAIEKKSGKKVATVIEPLSEFFPAEEYHQDYYKKNPLRYKLYKKGSGR